MCLCSSVPPFLFTLNHLFLCLFLMWVQQQKQQQSSLAVFCCTQLKQCGKILLTIHHLNWTPPTRNLKRYDVITMSSARNLFFSLYKWACFHHTHFIFSTNHWFHAMSPTHDTYWRLHEFTLICFHQKQSEKKNRRKKTRNSSIEAGFFWL